MTVEKNEIEIIDELREALFRRRDEIDELRNELQIALDTKKESRVIGTMVACLACNTVVWAMDSDYGDLRGTLNMLKIPCRLCGEEGNYDGYSVNTSFMSWWETAVDGWSTMRLLASYEKWEWNPSPDNTWR